MTNKRPSIALTVTVHDVTGHENEYDLDQNGFQFVQHASEEKVFDDEERIKILYYAEVEQLLKDQSVLSGPSHVFYHVVHRFQACLIWSNHA